MTTVWLDRLAHQLRNHRDRQQELALQTIAPDRP
jgi:hypothetical protein